MSRLPDPKRSLGYAAVAWIEHFLVHGPGDVQGEPIELDSELAAFVVKAYEVDAKGRRVFDESFFSRAKGRAKSELAGMLVCFEFLGPCRFDHKAKAGERIVCPVCRGVIYEFDPGDAVGIGVTYPFIRCMATEEGQAGNTYDNVSFMLADVVERHAAAFPKIDIGQRAQTSTRVFRADGGEIRPSTASSAAKDGGKETFTVFDESHLYITPETRRMYDTVSRNGRKRLAAEPWLLQTSTMYGIGEDSIAERTHKGFQSNRLPRLLFDHVEAPDHLDPEHKPDRVKGLKVCYGPAAAWMPIDKIADDYRDPRVDKGDWLRYFWNRATSGSSDLVNAAEWDALAREDLLRPGDVIALGFDGSKSDDSTALLASRLDDNRLFVVGVWERPPNAGPDWVVPRVEVDSTVTATFAAYEVAMMFGDPNKWAEYFSMWEAKWPKRVAAEWPSDKSTDRGFRLLLENIKDGSLTHDGSEVLARHVRNASLYRARLKPNSGRTDGDEDDPLGKYYLSIRKKGGGKIDAAWAAMLAGKARAWSLEHGWLDQSPGGWMVALN